MGTKKVGETREETATQIIVRSLCRRMSTGELQAELARIDRMMAATRADILAWQSRNHPQLVAQFEFWEKVADEKREEVELSFYKTVLSLVIQDQLLVRQQKVIDLSTKERESLAALIGKWASANEKAFAAHRKVVEQLRFAQSTRDVIEAADKLLGAAEWGQTTIELVQQVKAREFDQAKLALLGSALTVIVDRVPTWKAIHTLGENGVTLFFSALTIDEGRRAVSDLQAISEMELRNVGSLAKRYASYVDNRKQVLGMLKGAR